MNKSKVILCIALLAGIPNSGRAGEPVRAFLDGLRERGFYDTAIEYLDQMAGSPLAPPDLKATIGYEKALILIAFSRRQSDPGSRAQLLDDAQRLLQAFIENQASHPKSNAARSQLGSLIFERARMKVEQSQQLNQPELLAEARKLYQQAYEVFVELQKVVAAQLDQIPKILDTSDRKQAQLAERRKQLRADNLQTELLAAAIREETADTLPDGSAQQAEYLNEAAALYDGIYKNYRGRLAGFYARLYQGRCNQRLGKLRDALGYYDELLDQPNESEGMFTLKTKTLRRAMECWLAPSQRKYIETIKRGSQWLAMAPDNQDRGTDWLAIRLSLARALKMQADAAQQREPPDVRTVRQSIDAALKHAKFVAAETGDLQEPAKELVDALGGMNETEQDATPQSFSEARLVAKQSLDAIEPAKKKLRLAEAKWSAARDQDEQQSLGDEVQAARDHVLRLTDQAVSNFRLALELADSQTPRSDVNLVRYLLTYLYYQQQQYFESALMGEFVTLRYPESAGAFQCAKIALASYLNLYVDSNENDRQYETKQLVTLAEHLADRWPGPETDESLAALIPHLVNAGELERATRLTEAISEDSIRRGEAERTTGQAHWAAAARLAQQLYEARQQPNTSDTKLAQWEEQQRRLQDRARELLTAGYKRLPEQPIIDTPTATALLSLARAHLAADDHQAALDVLENPEIGPLTLVQQQEAAVASAAFAEETRRTALQAYVGSLSGESDSAMQKATKVMSALRQSVADDPAGKQRLLNVYTNLALNLETQLKSASPETKQRLSKAFDTFLKALASEATDPDVLTWVAETLGRIGDSLADADGVPGEQAKEYYRDAIVAFDNLLADPRLPNQNATQVRVHKAEVLSKLQQFPSALAELETVLAANANALNVQVEAARLLQAWGQQDPSRIEQAISGVPSGSSAVWGWGKIASATQTHRQFRETFFEARLQLARCLFALAQIKSGNEQSKLWAQAERTLALTSQLYPGLGGAERARQYNQLLNEIRKAQGKAPLPLDVPKPAPDVSTTNITNEP